LFLSIFTIFMNNKFYFPASTEDEGAELWSSDGTTANTQLFMDINPGTDGSSAFFLPDFFGITNLQGLHTHLYNGKIFFEADDGTNGTELWITDGTVPGTMLVKDINTTGDALGNLTWFYSQSGLYFAASDGINGNELWKSDGTAGGTSMIIDLNPNTGDADP